MTSGSNTGWQCPLCKTVYSPSVTKCDCAKVNVLEGAPSQHYDFDLCKYIND